MDQSNYLHVRVSGKNRLTLSLTGIERAVRNGRLTQDAEAWLDFVDGWVPLDSHPAVLGRGAGVAVAETAVMVEEDEPLVEIEQFSAEHLTISDWAGIL